MYYIVIGFVLSLPIITFIADRFALGPWLSDVGYREKLKAKLADGRLNIYSSSIISLGESYVSTTPIPLFGKYYWSKIGLIPRWTQMSKDIDAKFEELNT